MHLFCESSSICILFCGKFWDEVRTVGYGTEVFTDNQMARENNYKLIKIMLSPYNQMEDL
jgi:hypothetical protein